MSKNIPIDRVDEYIGDHYDALLHACVLECDARLKLATPVDTGRLRNAWTIGENTTPGSKPDGFTGDKQSPRVVADASTRAVKINRTTQKYSGYTAGQEKMGNQYIIANNMEYAEPVAYGTNLPRSWGGTYRSKQNAVPGYPELIAKGMERWLQREWDRMAERDR